MYFRRRDMSIWFVVPPCAFKVVACFVEWRFRTPTHQQKTCLRKCPHQTRRSPAVPGPLVTVFRLCCLPCNAGATGTEIANFVETCVIEIVQDLEADRGGLKKLQRKKHAKFVMCEPQVRSGKPIRRINTSTRMFDRIDIFDESFWYHLKFPDS